MRLERTCKCIKEYVYVDDVSLGFHNGREYQVDILDETYKVYQNGGWYDFAILYEEEFKKYFRLIE